MKALTLTQPWATLVALSEKRIETRSWYTPHRGPLAIHAAKGQPAWAREFEDELFATSGDQYGFELPLELPRGAVVATCWLVDCLSTNRRDRIPGLIGQEYDFGDFSTGRFAWVLDAIEPVPEPIPAKGALGLWDWDATDVIAAPKAAHRAQLEMAL